MDGRLDGTTAVVTGASSGIGAATAQALAREGATVVLFARRRDRLDEVVARIREESGDRAHAVEVDVTDADAVAAAIDGVVAEHGQLDVLVNNAGYGHYAPAAEADLTEWQRMVDVNITGVLVTTHAAVQPLVRAAQGPRGVADVVTVSSVAGRKVASPDVNVYATTKHAVGAFSEALRQELAPRHVRVGLVEPGLVRSELTEGSGAAQQAEDSQELGLMEAEDIADAIAYMVTRPRRAAVNEVLIRPTEQTR